MSQKTFATEIFKASGPCYESHPALVIGEYKIYGGSAQNPVVKDADIYVSLQSGSASGYRTDPWTSPKVEEVYCAIPDMGIPKNIPRFKKMVTWLCNQLQEGKKVHIGCIGGHGRTGLLLAAIVSQLSGEKDAIAYVRKNYCGRAVESSEQVKFLGEHYGITPVKGTKEYTPKEYSVYQSNVGSPNYSKVLRDNHTRVKAEVKPVSRSIPPVDSGRNIFKKRVKAVN